MKNYLGLALFFLSLNSFAYDRVVPEEISFTPPRYFIGDLITMQFKIITGEENLNTPVYENSEKLSVEDIELDHQGDGLYLVTVKFRAYVIGSNSISFDFGDFYVDNIPFFVSSVLDSNIRELRPSHNVELLLGTKLILILIFLIILLIPPLMLYSSKKLLHLFILLKTKLRSPFRQFKRSLGKINRKTSLNDKDLYFLLLDLFRNYLSEITTVIKYKSATNKELYELLKQTFNKTDADLAYDLFTRADLVKFSTNSQENRSRRSEDINLVYKLARTIYRNGGILHANL